MKAAFTQSLRCPACRRDRVLALLPTSDDGREVREGTLRCAACERTFDVHRGVAELLFEPPEHVRAEAAGLERFAEHMRASGWDRETIRRLPHHDSGYWYVQLRSLYQMLLAIRFVDGQTVLDVGSNTCWAANQFAQRGLRAVALDIATAEMQGLYTAEYFIEEGDVFFERVLGSMDSMPLADESVDYVFCCEVLHHNDAQGLRRTFAEAFRVLRPGGRVLMVNETLKTVRDPRGVHTEGVDPFEGHEHAYWAWQYRWEAIRAGFYTEVMEPHYRPFFGDATAVAELDGDPRTNRVSGVAARLQGSRAARRLYLAWLNHVWGGVSMNMVATKPHRFVGRAEGSGPARRVASMAAAGAVMQLGRLVRSPTVPARLPRTPEQAQHRALAVADSPPVEPSPDLESARARNPSA